MRSWELSQLQRQAVAKRRDIEILDGAVSNLESMLSEARAFEAHYAERSGAIRAKRGELRFKRYPTHMDAQGIPMGGPPPEIVAEDERLEREEQAAENEQRQEVAARRVHATDGIGLDRSWSPLSANDVERRLQNIRRHRAVAGAALAGLEDQLSAGEIVQTGQPAPDYVANRDRVAALRERLA